LVSFPSPDKTAVILLEKKNTQEFTGFTPSLHVAGTEEMTMEKKSHGN
jgi:hypothetical protein